MKLNKTITKALLAIMAFAGLASCSSDDYEMAGKPSNAQVYFSNESDADFLLAENQNSVQVEVKRVKTEGAQTVNVSATDESGLFNVPSSVSFEDGKNTAMLTINFNFSDLTPDVSYPITLKLQDETTVYGDAETTVNIKYAPWSQWEEMGDGEATFTYMVMTGGTYLQETYYRESMLDPSKAQIMMTDWFYGVNLIVDWDKTTNRLDIAPQFCGYNHSSYGKVYVCDQYYYATTLKGKDVAWEDNKSYYDPATGQFRMLIAYFVPVEGGYGTFGAAYENLQLPGYTQMDYSLAITDEGSFQSGKKLGQVFTFTMGADVASVKYATFAGALTDEQIAENAEGIFSGDIAYKQTNENGYKVEMVEGEGDYTLVAVLYDADNNRVGENVSLPFTVKAPVAGNTWTPIFVGDYTYTLFFGSAEEPSTDSDLVLYQCNEDPTLFRIEHWGYDVDFLFNMDEEGNIVVNDVFTGYTDSKYGEIMVGESKNVLGTEKYGVSSYANGIFSFGVAYYSEAGVFAAGIETFKLTAEAQKAITRAQAIAKANENLKANTSLSTKKFEMKSGKKFSFNANKIAVMDNKPLQR